MKKNSVQICIIVFNIFFSLFLFGFVANALLFGFCFFAAGNLPGPEYQVMRINIFGSSQNSGINTVSANISILDTQGGDCAVVERSWNGNYLYITFRTAEFYGKKYYFPEKISGRESAVLQKNIMSREKGTRLLSYYLENNQCYLLGNESTFWQRKNMYVLARFAFSPLSAVASGFSSRCTVNLSECEYGKYYGIYADESGRLLLKEQ